MLRRGSGFTLIELLVVIAIIGILAAMLFPVFARAREAARKIQCLSNVKNIAMAFQMYFIDYDRMPPREHDAARLAFFEENDCDITPGCCPYPTYVNPYLRWPVILDEYIKNRDVWKCPSARNIAEIGRVYGQADYWNELMNNWPNCVCHPFWPPGWGGSVTDNVILEDGCPQGSILGGANGAFEMDLSLPSEMYGEVERSISSIDDPAKHVVVFERGCKLGVDRTEQLAYPEACRITWGSVIEDPDNCGADWTNCSETQVCGVDKSLISKFWNDPSWRSKFTRHLGGNNIGFADGHAKWWPADAIIAAANRDAGEIEPFGPLHVPDWIPGEHW